jgi:hypothetical protein
VLGGDKKIYLCSFIRKDKNLTAPLTFILSRRGREEMEGKIFQRTLTLALSRGLKREKN